MLLLRADLRRELSLDELAQSLSLSTSRLRHLFTAEVGLSPAQYRAHLLVKRLTTCKESELNSFKRNHPLLSTMSDAAGKFIQIQFWPVISQFLLTIMSDLQVFTELTSSIYVSGQST